jgi:lipopolysaccharide transport system ATP-binding protein
MSWAVRFEGVTKEYRRDTVKYRSLRADAARLVRRSGHRSPPPAMAALRQLSFEIEQGVASAIVGRNGAGKSTALKLMSRVTYPSQGKVRVRGRVGALIEIGAGVHPELTGRENIWLYGTFLGFNRAGIRRRFDEIVAFSEIGPAVDRQVKHYSTGMALRLGFAIAAHLEPAIFIVDESLAVGDGSFQAKCMGRMRQLGAEGSTIVFVSHELASVEALCDRALWLHQGELRDQGPIGDVLRAYNRSLEEEGSMQLQPGLSAGGLACVGVTLIDRDRRVTSTFTVGSALEVELTFEAAAPVANAQVSIRISGGQWEDLVECVSPPAPRAGGTTWSASCRIEAVPLNPRLYQIWCRVSGDSPARQLLDWTEVASFRITPDAACARTATSFSGPPVAVQARWWVGP